MEHLSENVRFNPKAEEYVYESEVIRYVRSSTAWNNPGKDEAAYEELDSPHQGFFFILPYLDLQSLFTLERVSKSIRSRVKDILVWNKLLVEPPLSRKLSDRHLLSLVKRSEGHLKCIILVDCLMITHEMLAHVLSLSPRLEKLYVPGCSKLCIEAVVEMVKVHAAENRAKGLSGIKHLQVRGLYYMTKQHLNALRTVVLSGDGNQARRTKPVYFNDDPMLPQNARPIDVEICPRCRSETPVVVYDCTSKTCQRRKLDPTKACRGCIMCISRCIKCGVCFTDDCEEVTCCYDLLCETCWCKSPKCSECYSAFCRKHTPKSTSDRQGKLELCGVCG